MKFKCKRCGKCCQFTVDGNQIPADYWKKASLTDEQMQQLKRKRLKYAGNAKGCQMLVVKDDKFCCLLHELFGEDKKPEECKRYPDGLEDVFCFETFKNQILKITVDDDYLVVTTKDGNTKQVKLSEVK